MVSRFRSEAAKRLKDVQRAEDAADEALLKFGTNVRDFLREAVTVTAPEAAAAAGAQIQSLTGANTATGQGEKGSEVIFETNDAEGRRVFHSSRLDAQLHAIHSRADSFLKDPEGNEWENWQNDFDVEKDTERIAQDLEKHDELRRQMGRLVPERVEYAAFWRRYYFLRKAVEEEEKKRKEVLKGMSYLSLPSDRGSPGRDSIVIVMQVSPRTRRRTLAGETTRRKMRARRAHLCMATTGLKLQSLRQRSLRRPKRRTRTRQCCRHANRTMRMVRAQLVVMPATILYLARQVEHLVVRRKKRRTPRSKRRAMKRIGSNVVMMACNRYLTCHG